MEGSALALMVALSLLLFADRMSSKDGDSYPSRTTMLERAK